MIEMKVEQGLAVAPNHEQMKRCIQSPLRVRRERLGLTERCIVSRTGLSSTTISQLCGVGNRSNEARVLVSVLAKVLDALELPVSVETFGAYLSIGGHLLAPGIVNARPQIREWRSIDGVEEEEEEEEEPEPTTVVEEPIGATLTFEQAGKLFATMLPACDASLLVDELRRRDVLESIALEYARGAGWVVIR